MMYLELPSHGTWEWLFVFIFTACAVMRLARFNVEQAGRKKTYFHGLPSPAAGLTLATYYWFSQTPLYNQAVILFTNSTLSELPWHVILRGLMAVLAALMISEVPYPNVPSIGWRTPRKLLGSIVVAGSIVLLVVRKEEFIFPALLLVRSLRLRTRDDPRHAWPVRIAGRGLRRRRRIEPPERDSRRGVPARTTPRMAAAGVVTDTIAGRSSTATAATRIAAIRATAHAPRRRDSRAGDGGVAASAAIDRLPRRDRRVRTIPFRSTIFFPTP